MKLPEYITKEEVSKFCKALKIRDWTKLKEAKVLPKEAKIILAGVNTAKGWKWNSNTVSGSRTPT
jgi:ABC-type anion transport system duplicated permease subunit